MSAQKRLCIGDSINRGFGQGGWLVYAGKINKDVYSLVNYQEDSGKIYSYNLYFSTSQKEIAVQGDKFTISEVNDTTIIITKQ